MSSVQAKYVIFEKTNQNGRPVTIVRFSKPNLSEQLLDDADIAHSPLYQDLDESVLSRIEDDESLILNFGVVEVFNSAFYRLLLQLREAVTAKNGRMLLCNPTPLVSHVFELFGAPRLFEVSDTEREALIKAGS